jgi:hypothetical protein
LSPTRVPLKILAVLGTVFVWSQTSQICPLALYH